MHIPNPLKPRRVAVAAYVTIGQREQLRRIAAENNCTLARVVEYAIEELLARDSSAGSAERVAPAVSASVSVEDGSAAPLLPAADPSASGSA